VITGLHRALHQGSVRIHDMISSQFDLRTLAWCAPCHLVSNWNRNQR